MPDVIAPISPTIIMLDVKSDTAVISWLPSIDDELKGYRLYRCFESDTTQWTLIGGTILSPFVTVFTDTGLYPDTTYCYQISAEDTTGNVSAPSNRYTVKTNPTLGENLVAGKLKASYNKRKKSATVSWNPVNDADVQGNIIYRKEGSGRFIPLTDLLTKESEYTDTNLEPEKSYHYQLRTFYKDGNMTISEPVEVIAK
jgi:fibronectin type 3 domain-containing protein